MRISKQLRKIALFIDDPLQRITKYQFNIKFYDNKIFIINSFKLTDQNENDINNQINYMLNTMQKHSKFIETKTQFHLNKKQTPKQYDQFITVFGAYNCKNISNDEIKKIIYQWNNFGYKGGIESNKKIKTTQNSVY